MCVSLCVCITEKQRERSLPSVVYSFISTPVYPKSEIQMTSPSTMPSVCAYTYLTISHLFFIEGNLDMMSANISDPEKLKT